MKRLIEVRAASAAQPPVRNYAREGVPLSLSTLADQVGGCCAALAPLLRRVARHVFAAERLHGDDTTVPVLAKGKTDTGRCWVYVRDDDRIDPRLRAKVVALGQRLPEIWADPSVSREHRKALLRCLI